MIQMNWRHNGFLLFSIFLCLAAAGQPVELTPAVFHYPGGQVSSEGFTLDGKPEGYWKTYYPNGTLKSEGNRQDFLIDGLWKFYTEDGEPKETIQYMAAKRNGETKVYRDGQLREVSQYIDDQRFGVAVMYDENGLLSKEIPFENDLENGRGYQFSEAGDITVIMNYKDGFVRSSERINRVDKLSRKQGYWKTFYEDKSVHTEGVYVDDLKNGLFKTYDEEGKMVLLEKYVNGVLDTQAAETTVLDIKNEYYPGGKIKVSGSYKDGKKHGVFREYDEEGTITGSTVYENDEAVSFGIIDKTGAFEGDWITYYDDGTTRAEGIYENGLRVDKWKFYHPDGKVSQKGSYRKGKPHGEWRWYHRDGSIKREETYRRGRGDGEAVEYDEEGNVVAKGSYIDGLKDGDWFYTVGDHTVTGAYRDGEKQGKWLGVYENGKTQFKGEFSSGLAIGKQKFYFANGFIQQEGKFNSGRKNGDWNIYTDDGELLLTVKFRNGIETHLEGNKIIPTYQELQID